MLKDFIDGFNCALSGFSHIKQPGIKRFVIIPLLINILLFIIAFWFAIDKISILIESMISYLPEWLAWLDVILWFLFGIVGMLVIFYTFVLVANFIGSPFNAILAEKLETKLSGGIPPSSGRPLTLASIKDSITSETRKLAYLLVWVIPLFLVSFIPLLNLTMPFIWFIFGAWMMSIEYLDYPMGNHEINFSDQKQRIKNNRALALGYGTVIMLITTIPIVNFFAMPVAVAGATQLWVKHLSRS